MPSENIRVQHGSTKPIGISFEDIPIQFISVERAKSLIEDLSWALARSSQYEGSYDTYMCMHCSPTNPCFFQIENGSDAPEICPLKGSSVATWVLRDTQPEPTLFVCPTCNGTKKVMINFNLDPMYAKPCPDCAGKQNHD
jgi:hypothetical protein